MRPRRVPRNHLRGVGRPPAPLAEGFNEAEARASESLLKVRHPGGPVQASMRPRRVPRNHNIPSALSTVSVLASMRPRRVPRNHRGPGEEDRGREGASMRPRRVPRNHFLSEPRYAAGGCASMRPRRVPRNHRPIPLKLFFLFRGLQ